MRRGRRRGERLQSTRGEEQPRAQERILQGIVGAAKHGEGGDSHPRRQGRKIRWEIGRNGELNQCCPSLQNCCWRLEPTASATAATASFPSHSPRLRFPSCNCHPKIALICTSVPFLGDAITARPIIYRTFKGLVQVQYKSTNNVRCP